MNPSQQQYQPSRQASNYSSHNDELHLASQASMSHQGQMSPRDYSSAGGPHIKLEQSPNAPQMQNYPNSASGAVPNVLQPGGMSSGARPSLMSANSSASSGMGQQQSQQRADYQTPTKPNPLGGLAHTYSRSSPQTSYEGGSSYVPYTPNTPGGSAGPSSSQYISPTDSKYNTSSSQRNVSNTPLGLADIRPRADSNLSDGLPGTPAYELANASPRTSSYLTPWALYAFDWCKWQPQGNSAGKVAIGSYLEDGHNFVSYPCALGYLESVLILGLIRYKSSTPS